MTGRPDLALVHDGELEDVRTLLDALGVEYACWRKSHDRDQAPDPSRLLIVSANLAVALRYRRVPGGPRGAPIWIAIVDNDAKSLRSFLAQSGFTYVVRRPVHPSALRMLVMRALWTGTDGRKGLRVAVGADVSLRVGYRRLRGTLIDLSPNGCRLFVPESHPPGTALSVQLPGDLAGGARFSVSGKVLRVAPAEPEGGKPGEHSVAVRFDPVMGASRDGLRALLTALASGPASREPADGRGRKRAPRARYGEHVHSLDDGAGTLVARDLSLGGIRIEPGAPLVLGRLVRLAIHTGGRGEPVIVSARVARDDGVRGLALRFEEIEGDGLRRLEQLVARLPPVESSGPPTPAQQLLSQISARLLRFRK
jgi:hypothetical protein